MNLSFIFSYFHIFVSYLFTYLIKILIFVQSFFHQREEIRLCEDPLLEHSYGQICRKYYQQYIISYKSNTITISLKQPLRKAMFSSLRNYSRNIDQSERFYYDNYDYYNIYESIEKDYRDDLSKFTYHCTRRTTPLITTYSPTSQRFKHGRVLKPNEQQWKNMQDFVNQIVKVYIENNYCVQSQNYEREASVQPFILQYVSPVTDVRYQKYSPYQMFLLNSQELIGCLGMIIQKNEQKLKLLQDQYAEDDGHQSVKVSTVQFHYALELYSERMLKYYYTSQQSNNQNYLLLLFQFVVEVHRIVWQILNARSRTVLLMAQPKISPLSLILHPLMLPITTFLKYSPSDITAETSKESPSLYKLISLSEQKTPKIVFINLDGRQTVHNLRCIDTMGAEMMYVSLFEEPGWIDRKETQMENLYTSYEEGFEVSYANLWEIYSEAIIKEYKQIVDSSKSKILLFPLNSTYIRKTYLQSCFQSASRSSSSNSRSSPSSFASSTLSTSQQIHLLFQQILYEQIRNYKPTIIFISYNGQLSILQQHFVDIIRNCSIVVDHRVVLFPNFVHFFAEQSQIYVSEEDQHGEKVQCAHQFYQKYMNYKISDINQQRLYSNICLFLKYAPGFYSMQDRIIGNPSMRTTLHKLYSYLQTLSSIPQFASNSNLSVIANNSLHKWSSFELQSLYGSYIKWELKQNKKDNKYYQGLLNTIINEFVCKNITQSQLESVLGKKLIMRYRWIAEELGREFRQMCSHGRQMRKLGMGRGSVGEERGGGKEMQDEEYQENQHEGNIWGSEAATRMLEDYFQNQKEKLLTENLQNYKIKKFFHLPQNQKSFGQVNCFKFILQIDNKQSQQIYLQKYSQIITNQIYQQLFILNHKTADNRHISLHGSIKNSQIEKQIIVMQIKQTDQQMNQDIKASFQQIYLDEEGLVSQKQDIVFVQYNHCLYERTLYLFWPLLWNLKQQARHKLLGLQYKPKRVNKMIKIFQYQNQLQFRFQNLLFEPSQIPVLPRWGCTCHATSNVDFKIFGGIYDNENDYKMIGSGINIAHIKDNGKYKAFTIASLPKTKLMSPNKQPITCLRPKINYTVRIVEQKMDQQCVRLSGGYGRDFTGFFNMFSYDQYDLNNTLTLQKVFDGNKFNRRVVVTEKPLEYEKIGKFNVIINNYNVSQIQQKFSDGLKDKFVFQKRIQSSNKTQQWELQAFIDETYRVNEFKTDPKKIFLFGFNRTVREKIYLKCWSPELYIIDGIKNYIVNLSLKTEKTSSYVITNYLMPREQDIVSLCLEQDKLYLLSNSPIIHSIDRAGLKFVLYEGSLTNINEIIRKKQIQMITKHNFSEQCQKYLSEKSMFVFQQKIYLTGGICSQYQNMSSTKLINEREDYILQLNKNRFKIKIRKLESNQISLDMPNSVVVKQSEYFYNYSIVFQNEPTDQDQKQGIQWKIKIQKFSYQNSESSKIKVGGFKTYIHKSSNNTQQGHIIQKYSHSNIDQPKLVKIVHYKRFNITHVREIIAKIVWRIDKNQQMQNNLQAIIKLYHNQNNDKQLMRILEKQWNNYEELFYSVKKRLEEATQINFEQEELLKDLKILYQLIFKMILEKHLYLAAITTVQSSQVHEYLFIAQDKSSRKSKYMAVGPLYTTKLNFFKFRFKNQLLINLNQTLQDQNILFYHPTVLGYYKFEYDQSKGGVSGSGSDFVEWGAEELLKNVNVSIKQ